MIRLGLIGYPIDHSLSLVLHVAALHATGLQGAYSLYPIRPGGEKQLVQMVARVRTGDLTGLNVTIPHKQAIMPFLDVLARPAELIGAVNTIYLKDGQVVGDNTDASGFLADLDRFASSPASALVLGAGGAARAVVYALRTRHRGIVLAARKADQAKQLVRRFPAVEATEMSVEGLAGIKTDLIVNATPVGMAPHLTESPWPLELAFPEDAFVYDLVYNPAETKLVQLARAAGLRATTGLGMLIEQAILAFELWTGCKVQQEVMLQAVAQSAHI